MNNDQAHRAVAQAIRSGRLTRPDACSECSALSKPDAHHEDYDKPLDVIWLCRRCHKKRHRSAGPSMVRICFRLKSEAGERMKVLAQSNFRTFTQEVQLAIARHLEASDGKASA